MPRPERASFVCPESTCIPATLRPSRRPEPLFPTSRRGVPRVTVASCRLENSHSCETTFGGAQLFGEKCAPSVQIRPHRADGTSHHRCGLFIAQFLQVAKHDRLAVLRR